MHRQLTKIVFGGTVLSQDSTNQRQAFVSLIGRDNCLCTDEQSVNYRKRWFESYLSNHRQQEALSSRAAGRRLSRALPNPLGTYQGSALGPLLYNIYSNDMPLHVDDANIIQYADDTQVLVSGSKQMSQNI